MKKSICILCAAFCIVVLGACLNLWDASGNQGTITINFGNSDARLLVSDDEKAAMEYTVILTDTGGRTITGQFTGSTAVIAVPSGIWNIKLRAVGETPYEYLESGFPDRMLRGIGEAEKPVEVKAGATVAASINMTIATEVTNWAQLCFAFAKADTGGKPEYVMITANSLEVGNTAFVGGPVGNNGPLLNQRITLCAENNVTITRADEFFDPLFKVDPSGVLTLGGVGSGKITISGNRNSYNQSLIKVYQGELVMRDGAILTGNFARNGGGVYVESGTFSMQGGIISGNTASYGGGVYVEGGTFSKTGGTIYGQGNADDELLQNTAQKDTAGHAVYVSGQVSNYKNKTSAPEDYLYYSYSNGLSLFLGSWDLLVQDQGMSALLR